MEQNFQTSKEIPSQQEAKALAGKQATEEKKQKQRSKPASGDRQAPRDQNKKSGSGAHGGSAKLRGLPKDSEEVRMSKTLSWILRHGSASEGLAMRPDGYARLQDILSLPRFKDYNLGIVQRIVAHDSKTRFNLISEADASSGGIVWWIRANQGHSIKAVVELETKPVLSLSDIPTGVAVHGTNWKAWESIRSQGLSKMRRNHIHCAQGLPGESGIISGMRGTSDIYIFIDIERALAAGIRFGLSHNGVVLSEGDDKGYILPTFFQKVLRRNGSSLVELPTSSWTSTSQGQKK